MSTVYSFIALLAPYSLYIFVYLVFFGFSNRHAIKLICPKAGHSCPQNMIGPLLCWFASHVGPKKSERLSHFWCCSQSHLTTNRNPPAAPACFAEPWAGDFGARILWASLQQNPRGEDLSTGLWRAEPEVWKRPVLLAW